MEALSNMNKEKKFPREKLLNLRKKLIEYMPNSYAVSSITEALINYPECVSFITDWRKLPGKYVERKYTSTGHGAFGEPEGYVDYYLCGRNCEIGYIIMLNSKDEPVNVLSVDFEKTLKAVKEEHDKSFTI
jgi:hypothetical protein